MSTTGTIPGSALGRIGARLAPGAGGFLSWWGRSLAQLLPRRLRDALELEPGRILLQPGYGEAALPVQDHKLPRWLLLPAEAALVRTLRLPAAAAGRLREVVGFEIERQTPFAASAVVYDARVLGPVGDGQAEVALVVVPRARLQPVLDALGPLAGTLAGVDVAGAGGQPLGVNLLPVEQRHRLRDPWSVPNRVLAAVAVLAVVAAAAQLLDNRREAADALEATLAARADAARQEAAGLRQAQLLLEGQGFLERTRAARPAATAVLAELTRRLPDDTYLEKLSIEGDQLTLIGLGRNPAALVGQLQGAGLWHSPALAGAVMPDPGSGRDRFTLTARLAAPETGPAPAAGGMEDADGDGPG